MKLSLYQISDSHNVLNKQKLKLGEFDITFKKQTNILSPVIPIYSDTEIPSVDYAYIDELQRYYHIVNIEPKSNNIFIFYLEVDVIETYKDDILQGYKVRYNNSVDVEMEIINSDYKPQEVKYVLSTLGHSGGN